MKLIVILGNVNEFTRQNACVVTVYLLKLVWVQHSVTYFVKSWCRCSEIFWKLYRRPCVCVCVLYVVANNIRW